MTRHYVEFYFPGSFFAETSVKEIGDRDDVFKIPKGCYGYCFFDREEVMVDGEKLTGKRKNQSGMVFFGKKYSVKELKRKFPDEKRLISNVERNGFEFAVRTVIGNWQPVREGDTVKEHMDETK